MSAGAPPGRRQWCRTATTAFALVAGVLLLSSAPADYAAAGKIRDLMLIYAGEGRWSAEDFRPYVAYLGGPDGRSPQDWFYDSFLFLQYGGAPSGALYINGQTTKADWQRFQDLIFEPESHLHALDAGIHDATAALGAPPRRTPVVVMIPYPHPEQTDFGDVDEDGVSEDLTDPGQREVAICWHLDAVIQDFADAGFAHLELYGFYWMIEWVPPNDTEDMIRRAAQAVHQRGLKFVWIPAYFAPAAARSTELGFDLSLLQPNYAFMEQQGRRPDPQRLCCAAHSAATHGLGLEIELHPSIVADPAKRANLLEYLSHGAADRDGYMRGVPHAYYQGYLTVKKLHDSPVAANRRLYDALYRFACGEYAACPPGNLATGRPCRFATRPPGLLPADAEERLTDGRWQEVRAGRPPGVTWPGPAAIDVDLGGPRPVGGVRVCYQTRGEGIPAPVWLSAHTSSSADEPDWEPVPADHSPQWEPAAGDRRFSAGAVRLSFPRREARRARLEVWPRQGASVCIDEVEVLPARSLAWGHEAVADRQGVSAVVLTDGLYESPTNPDTSFRLPAGRTELTIDLGLTSYVGQIAMHVAGREPSVPRSVVLHMADGPGGGWTAAAAVGADHAATTGEWLRYEVEPRDARLVSITVDAAEDGLPVDEIEVLAPPNLALRCPYRVEPEWTARYPDDGAKLTDGLRMERDFSDGRAVGWYNSDTTITLDLGEERLADAVQLGTEGGGYAAVSLPAHVIVLTSTDGATWRVAGDLIPDAPESGSKVLLQTLRVPLAPGPARYVRVFAHPRGWLMIDEVEVIAGGRNVAAGCSYAVTPPPDAEDKYADTTGAVLTDGVWGGTTFGEGQTVGWHGVAPAVELDLGREVQARTLRAFVLGGGRAGVWFPQRIDVLTASDPDAADWRPAGSTTQHPGESGEETIGAFMVAPLSAEPFRFLRIEFDLRGWLMLGEIEVHER